MKFGEIMKQMSFDQDCDYYVISDLHGQGKIYDTIMKQLDNEAISTGRKIKLIINGDIIDRGPESMRMLVDVMERVKGKKGHIDVIMLPGNHEEMMCSALQYYKEHKEWAAFNSTSGIWFHWSNHGLDTLCEFSELSVAIQKELLEFLKTLPLYCLIKSNRVGGKSYVIVHAKPPVDALTASTIPTLGEIVSDNELKSLRECLTYRKNDDDSPKKISLPDDNVITIIGHTPVENANGYEFLENKKVLVIDGGCAYMADNPDSIFWDEMASLVKISDVNSPVIQLYGGADQKGLRQRGIERYKNLLQAQQQNLQPTQQHVQQQIQRQTHHHINQQTQHSVPTKNFETSVTPNKKIGTSRPQNKKEEITKNVKLYVGYYGRTFAVYVNSIRNKKDIENNRFRFYKYQVDRRLSYKIAKALMSRDSKEILIDYGSNTDMQNGEVRNGIYKYNLIMKPFTNVEDFSKFVAADLVECTATDEIYTSFFSETHTTIFSGLANSSVSATFLTPDGNIMFNSFSEGLNEGVHRSK